MSYLTKKEKIVVGIILSICVPAFILLEIALWTGNLQTLMM